MLNVVILAAGKGTRMKSALPKVLQTIAGTSMLEHVVNTARVLEGVSTPLTVVVGHGAKDVIDQCGAPDIFFVEQTEQLGTGHAVSQALPNLVGDGSTLILYGDVPLISATTLNQLIASTPVESMGILTVLLDNPKGYGRILRSDEGAITGIVEQKDANAEQLAIREVNTGIMLVSNRYLKTWLPSLSNDNAQGEYYLTDIVAMAKRDNVSITSVHPSEDIEVEGVNDRIQQSNLERAYQRKMAEDLMSQGAQLLDPLRFDCRGSVTVGKDVFIDINCIFEGDVELGDGVVVGPNCHLKNTVVGSGTVIKANSVCEDSVIKSDCDVGPFARIRPGTLLDEGAKIGNFVETKKAAIGRGSKVNHLSYVGDAELGDNVNVGAGTITCNYDGVNKSKTRIGHNAFIGSNSSLVAPVEVGDNATVGAGSTITANVSDGQLGVARAKQRSISNWQRPTKKSSS